MENTQFPLARKIVQLSYPSSLTVFCSPGDLLSVRVRVLEEYKDDTLLIEVASGPHEGRQFLIPRKNYEIEIRPENFQQLTPDGGVMRDFLQAGT